MPADLRTRLKALVEEWREEGSNDAYDCYSGEEKLVFRTCARDLERVLAALLAESEPCTVQECKDLGQCACFREPNPGKTHYQGDDCPGGHESKCGYCGAPCGWCSIEQRCPHGAGDGMCPVLGCGNYPGEPVLKLGHEFAGCRVSWCQRCHHAVAPPDGLCGQPREAH